MILEVCCGDIASVRAASEGGAQRVELCDRLDLDGLTPSIQMMREARAVPGLRLHVLIRCREGNFAYNNDEINEMVESIKVAREVGADGVVIGALTPQGDVDVVAVKRMMCEAQGMQVTFHRAFDVCRNPHEALEQIITLGCHRILTSGQAPNAVEGIPLLSELVQRAAGRIIIMPGAGVNEVNASKILEETGAQEIHGSLRSPSENGILVTDSRKVSVIMKKILVCLVAIVAFASCSHKSKVAEYMDFLYANMALPDSVDYDRAFYERNIESSLQARDEMPWGKSIPEREFKHFVLPVRVNNENLDSCRWVFYAELRDRVKDLSMEEAILEVNHWCHEHVTYTPSDSRTSSPLASIRTAYGRCGEESTLLVAALRSVGIPARQVYTPRWAHTDDNHAWVEAWADGKWHFLGACEPEPVLDLGWFNAPASRGMLMHTKAFGKYDGPEEKMLETACYTEINVTKNYAPVSTATVLVTDKNGKPAANAPVEFKIYNYAEFYTVSRKVTDERGIATLEAGMGDLVVWGCKDGYMGFERCHVAEGDTTHLCLNISTDFKEPLTFELNITPPVERNTLPPVTDEQRKRNDERLAHEDSLRNAYEATFDTSTALLTASRGNHAVIRSFIEATGDTALLWTLSSKDLRDVPMDVLEDHHNNAPERAQHLSVELFDKFVRCPRVANEMLTPYRKFFLDNIPAQQRAAWLANPQQLVKWIADSITIDAVRNPQNLRMRPMGVWKHRTTDAVSRNIMFVALARTCGIAARIDAVTEKVQYMNEKCEWVDVEFGKDEAILAPMGILRVEFAAQPWLDNPKYYIHFTVSALKDGFPCLLNYDDNDTYATTFKGGQSLDEGAYVMISGTRLASGAVLARVVLTRVNKGEETVAKLELRQPSDELQVIGNCNSSLLLNKTGRGFFAAAIIAPNNEPTNHILRDISQRRADLEAWGRPIVLMFRNEDEAKRFNKADFPQLPSTVIWCVDNDGAVEKDIRQQMKVTAGAPLPIVFIGDTFDRVVFFSQGYTINMGDQLMTAVNKLKNDK